MHTVYSNTTENCEPCNTPRSKKLSTATVAEVASKTAFLIPSIPSTPVLSPFSASIALSDEAINSTPIISRKSSFRSQNNVSLVDISNGGTVKKQLFNSLYTAGLINRQENDNK